MDKALPHFDLIVIGSGPAGCAAAIQARHQKIAVLIIAGKPGDISAAGDQPLESIHPGVLSVLSILGCTDVLKASASASYQGIDAAGYYESFGSDEGGPWEGYHVNRTLFDHMLLKTAVDCGAMVIENDPVADLILDDDCITGVITAGGQHILSKYVIDASGRKLIGGNKLHFRKKYFSPRFIVWTGVSKLYIRSKPEKTYADELLKPRFIPDNGGWTWLAHELPERCTWTRLTTKRKQKFSGPCELTADWDTAGQIKVFHMRWRLFRPLCKEGIILCGDAAGLLDPAAGQGILNALLSGIEAAKTVRDCFQEPEKETFYLARYDAWFSDQYEQKAAQLRAYYHSNEIDIQF